MATLEKSSSFTGNVERSIKLGKMFPGTVTADPPIKVGESDGAVMFTAKVGIIVDPHFPTKAGNETTTVIIVPLDGAKEFPIEGGKVKMDGIPPFIYGGRGVSHVFTTYADNGDVMKKKVTSRRSAQAEIDALNEKMNTILAALAAMAKK